MDHPSSSRLLKASALLGFLLLSVPGVGAARSGPADGAGRSMVIDANYPGGNIVVERIEGDSVYLRPDLRDTDGWWFYWGFRVSRVEGVPPSKRGQDARDTGRTLTFRFSGPNPIGVRGPAVSTDGGRTWSWLGVEAVQEASFRYTFAADAQEVRFCFAIPYLEQNLKEFLAKYKGNPNVAVQELCKSEHGRSVERLHVGRLEGDAPYRVLVTARHHACEAMANYVMEGLLEVVLADNEDGYWFRRNVEVLAVPFMDKDGVEEGDQGKNRKPRDHNRDYSGPSIHPSVAALRTFAPNWSNGRLKVALDLHCPYIRGPHNEVIYLVGSADERMWLQEREFGRLLETLQSGPLVYRASDNLPYGQAWNTGGNTGDNRSFGQWAGGLEGIRLEASFEFPYANVGGQTVTVDGARAFGRSLAKALRAYLEQTGREQDAAKAPVTPVPVNGVFPKLTVVAQGLGSNSEAGIGALIPWAQKLWAVGYVAHINGQGQPRSGLWFGNIDDLWRMGKPAGWGGPWWNTPVKAGAVSDPFLMTGFDKKVVHLTHNAREQVTFALEVDFLGDGSWRPYKSIIVDPEPNYVHHEFPDGFSAHWVRVRVDKDCVATVYFIYN